MSEKDYLNNSEGLIKKMPTKNKEIIEYAKRRNPINHMTV